MTAKISSRIVYLESSLPFSRIKKGVKKQVKKLKPLTFNPRKGEKNVMTAKLTLGIVFVVPCKPFSRKKSNTKISPPTFNPRKGVKKSYVSENSYRDRLCSLF